MHEPGGMERISQVSAKLTLATYPVGIQPPHAATPTFQGGGCDFTGELPGTDRVSDSLARESIYKPGRIPGQEQAIGDDVPTHTTGRNRKSLHLDIGWEACGSEESAHCCFGIAQLAG